MAKFRLGLDNLRDAGCPWVLIDGSFVTSKPNPEDMDVLVVVKPGLQDQEIAGQVRSLLTHREARLRFNAGPAHDSGQSDGQPS